MLSSNLEGNQEQTMKQLIRILTVTIVSERPQPRPRKHRARRRRTDAGSGRADGSVTTTAVIQAIDSTSRR
jgi:hypothetical protein